MRDHDAFNLIGALELVRKIAREHLADPNTKLPTRTRAALEGFAAGSDPAALVHFLSTVGYAGQREWQARVLQYRSQLMDLARGGKPPRYAIGQIPPEPLVELGVDLIQQFFVRNLRYLGPLRDEPKPVYPLAGAMDPRDTGLKGEHTAAVLELHRNTVVDVVRGTSLDSASTFAITTKMTLLEAVRDWLEYMGVGSNVVTSDFGKLGHKLEVTTLGSDAPHDVTHVGVGVSQLLPILVVSLIAEPGVTLIFEQPELHLHPRVQSRLADFFVSLTQLRKQCIVETHSEYFVNRLRYRAAMAPGADVADKISLYFVEKTDGSSSYRKIPINEYGVIEEWPRGFFDESDRIAAETLRAATNKARAQRDR